MALLDNIEPLKQRGSNVSGLLGNPAERLKRSQEKTDAVLRFLRTSIYSTAEILGHVMGVNTKSTVSVTLQAMERRQLIRRRMFQEMGGTFTLWGITPTGQQAALQDGDDPINVFFNVSKVSLAGLQHYLSLQQIRVRAERENWTQFIYCDRRSINKTYQQNTINDSVRPDLLAHDPTGRPNAIESERLLKSPRRYKERVIPGHVRRMNAGEYDRVIWVCPTSDVENTLRTILTNAIQELTKDKALYLEKAIPGTKPFNVTSLEAWPTF